MTKKEILNLQNFVAIETKIKRINLSVFSVQNCNFNDEWLLDSVDFKVEDIKDKPLFYTDLFLGKNKENKLKIAFAYLKGYDIYFIVDDGIERKVIKKEDFTQIFTAKKDDRTFFATHINLFS